MISKFFDARLRLIANQVAKQEDCEQNIIQYFEIMNKALWEEYGEDPSIIGVLEDCFERALACIGKEIE